MQVNANQAALQAQQLQQMQVNANAVGVANALNVNQVNSFKFNHTKHSFEKHLFSCLNRYLHPQLGGPASAADAKKGLSLTKEQMLEAQEMFKTSNKVTRPEKALILGFMAGSRGNLEQMLICFLALTALRN